MINPRKASCFLATFLYAFVPLALAQGTYTQIDYPGSTGTYCWGIDNAEEISGTFGDSGGYHGFLLSGGNFTVIDYPGAQNTYLNGLNDLGQIVGFARSPDIGFVYDVQTQSFTEIRYPGAPLTYPYSINTAGTVVGAFTDSHMRKLRGFELIDQTYKPRPPGRIQPVAYGVSDGERVVGIMEDQDFNTTSFSFDQTKYREIKLPGAPSAIVYGINGEGNSLAGVTAPVVTAPGFVYRKGILQTLQFPGGKDTVAYGVNNAGEVIGLFAYEGDAITHCFLWTPPSDAATK